MSLVAIEESFEGEVDGGGARYTFRGRSNNVDDTIESIKASPLCPHEGNPDPYNTAKQITNVSVRRASSDTKSLAWLVYVTSVITPLPTENPLNVRTEITLNSEQFEFLTCFNKDGKAILNRADSLVFVPKESSRWVFNIKKNVPSIPGYILSYANSTNNGLVTVAGVPCPKGTLMLKNLQGGNVQTVQVGVALIDYLSMSFQLHYREEGWSVPYPNVGFDAYIDYGKVYQYVRGPSGRLSYKVQIDPITGAAVHTSGKVRKRIQRNGKDVTEPQMLTDEGYLAEGPDGTAPTADQLIRLKAEVYSEKDFNQLPLTS